MGKFNDRLPVDADSLIRRLEQLERDVREMRAARRLEAATIGQGGVTIKGGRLVVLDHDGNELASLGRIDYLPTGPDGEPQAGLSLFRNDGSLAMQLADPLPQTDGYKQILRLFDAGERDILAEDATSGWGLAAPTMSHTLYPARYTNWPSSTSATFEELFVGNITGWNPYVHVVISHTSSLSGTTGEVRLKINGTSITPVAAVTFVIQTQIWTIQAPPRVADPADWLTITVEARRTAGTGGIHVGPTAVIGERST